MFGPMEYIFLEEYNANYLIKMIAGKAFFIVHEIAHML